MPVPSRFVVLHGGNSSLLFFNLNEFDQRIHAFSIKGDNGAVRMFDL
jgi:hypothetical protein